MFADLQPGRRRLGHQKCPLQSRETDQLHLPSAAIQHRGLEQRPMQNRPCPVSDHHEIAAAINGHTKDSTHGTVQSQHRTMFQVGGNFQAGRFASLLGDRSTAVALEDIAKMMETLGNLQNLRNVTELLPVLTKLSDSLPDLWRLLASARSPDMDFDFLKSVIGDVERMVQSADLKGWQNLKELLFYGQRVLNWLRYNLNKNKGKRSNFCELISVVVCSTIYYAITLPSALFCNVTE